MFYKLPKLKFLCSNKDYQLFSFENKIQGLGARLYICVYTNTRLHPRSYSVHTHDATEYKVQGYVLRVPWHGLMSAELWYELWNINLNVNMI